MLGAQIEVFAFNKPGTNEDRQDYDNDLYRCPAVFRWVDERNYAYGYNHQFLGNARRTDGTYHNFPVKQHRLLAPGKTVVFADSMGTAAGFSSSVRSAYENNGKDVHGKGNHGWALDPPRLTDLSDRGTGDEDSPRIAVDPRHRGKVNVVFADGHATSMTDHELGYRATDSGRYVNNPNEDADGSDGNLSVTAAHDDGDSAHRALGAGDGDGMKGGSANRDDATNNFFSGTGRDDDPPAIN